MTTYDLDVVAWAQEQAALLRAGRLDEIDAEHIAEEIEDVARAEIRELTKRTAVLVGYMIEWRFVPAGTRPNSKAAIRRHRNGVTRRLRRVPSLTNALADPDFWADVWDDAISGIASNLDYVTVPSTCPWSADQILAHDFLPDPGNTPDIAK